jgi:hypothetical protein
MADFSTSYRADALSTLTGAQLSADLSSNMGDMVAKYQEIKALAPAGGIPIIGNLVDPGESVKYTRDILENVKTRYKLDMSSELIDFVATAGNGGGLNLLNTPLMSLNNLAAQVTGTDFLDESRQVIGSVAKSIGISAPAGAAIGGIVGVTKNFASSLADGQISADEARGLASSAAAFAGTTVGAAIGGVAGPIGAAVGMIAGILIDLFQPPPPPRISPEVEGRFAALQERQALFDRLAEERKRVVEYCRAAEQNYWASFDKFFAEFGQSWAREEYNLGFKFGMRWFDDAYGPAFYADPGAIRRQGAAWQLVYDQPMQVPPDTNEANFQTFVLNGNEVTRCMLPMCGCPYPTIPGRLLQYPNGKLPTGDQMFSTGFRESYVFAARDVLWVPPEKRLDCERFIPYPSFEYLNSPGEYLKLLQRKQKDIQIMIARYRASQVLLQADLARTSAVMRSYLDLLANKAQYRAFGLGLGDGRLADFIESRHSLLNNTALVAGLGVLGYSIWRAVK